MGQNIFTENCSFISDSPAAATSSTISSSQLIPLTQLKPSGVRKNEAKEEVRMIAPESVVSNTPTSTSEKNETGQESSSGGSCGDKAKIIDQAEVFNKTDDSVLTNDSDKTGNLNKNIEKIENFSEKEPPDSVENKAKIEDKNQPEVSSGSWNVDKAGKKDDEEKTEKSDHEIQESSVASAKSEFSSVSLIEQLSVTRETLGEKSNSTRLPENSTGAIETEVQTIVKVEDSVEPTSIDIKMEESEIKIEPVETVVETSAVENEVVIDETQSVNATAAEITHNTLTGIEPLDTTTEGSVNTTLTAPDLTVCPNESILESGSTKDEKQINHCLNVSNDFPLSVASSTPFKVVAVPKEDIEVHETKHSSEDEQIDVMNVTTECNVITTHTVTSVTTETTTVSNTASAIRESSLNSSIVPVTSG